MPLRTCAASSSGCRTAPLAKSWKCTSFSRAAAPRPATAPPTQQLPVPPRTPAQAPMERFAQAASPRRTRWRTSTMLCPYHRRSNGISGSAPRLTAITIPCTSPSAGATGSTSAPASSAIMARTSSIPSSGLSISAFPRASSRIQTQSTIPRPTTRCSRAQPRCSTIFPPRASAARSTSLGSAISRPPFLTAGIPIVRNGGREIAEPSDVDRAALALGGKIVLHRGCAREHLVVGRGIVLCVCIRDDARGKAEIERPDDGIEEVRAMIAEDAGAEVEPVAPAEGDVHGIVIAVRRGAEPEIPFDLRWYGHNIVDVRHLVLRGEAAWANRSIGAWAGVRGGTGSCCVGGAVAGRGAAALLKDVHFHDFANGAVLHPLDDAAHVLRGMALKAGLRGLMGIFLRGLHHGAHFIDIVGKRLFAVDVLAALHGGQCGDGMSVVGGGDDDCVDLLVHLVEHDAPVVEALRVRVFLNGGGGHIVGART